MPVKKKDEENNKPLLVAEEQPEVAVAPETTPSVPEPVPTEVPASPPASQIFGPAALEPAAPDKKLFWVLIVVFTLLGAVAGGVGIYLQSRQTPVILPSPTPVAVATPTPTPAAQLDREDLAVRVLNGSGVTGAAAKAVEFLEGLGYVDVAAGNAASSDFATAQIAIKDSQKAYLPLLKEDLGEKYSLADETETLDEDNDYDVVITLGKE